MNRSTNPGRVLEVPVRSATIERVRGMALGRVSVMYAPVPGHDEEREVFLTVTDVENVAMLARQLIEGPAAWKALQAVLDAGWVRA
jgi:hypothetical protein